jgi:DNA-binding NarL/FixJ family response regulator
MSKIRVMLADDNEPMREALTMLLETQDDMEVVAHAADGLAVLAQLDAVRPDIICMDIHMDKLDGTEATRQLLLRQPEARVIGLSAHADLSRVAAMLQAGAKGYVVKDRASRDLPSAVRSVYRGQTFVRLE